MTKRVWLIALATTVGCGGLEDAASDGGTSTYSAALSGTAATDSQNALAITVSEGASFVVDSSTSASAAASATVAAFTPSGCATQTTTGAKVVYTFDDCAGPYGLVHVDGSLTVTYASTLKSIGAALSSSGLEVGSTTLDLAGAATYTTDGGDKLVLAPSGSATTASGDTIAWSGSITTTWTSTCLSLDGAYTFSVDGASWTVAATDYQRCEASCPAAGGSLALTGPNASLTIAYDGTATAKYTTSSSAGELPLLCGA